MMESLENPNLLNAAAKNYLLSSTKWAKVLAILNFIMGGLIAVLAFFIGTIMSTLAALSPANNGSAAMFTGTMGVMMTGFYLVVALLVLIPAYFLLNYANKTKKALLEENEKQLVEGLHNMKRYFQFNAILISIVFALYAVVIIFMLIGFSAMKNGI
jgi:heme/copper-type cytochrome/quinol oxidase subunit 2